MRWVCVPVLLALGAAVLASEFVCDPRTIYRENDCNTCLCNRNRYLICGTRRCILETRFRLLYCKAGTRYYNECNDCWCVSGFGTVCTHRKCA